MECVKLLRTRCCKCNHPFRIRPSIAMQLGLNSGHVSCPSCEQFLHVEVLEGDEAWTEGWNEYLDRTDPKRQIPFLQQITGGESPPKS